jgi:uncharacterized phage protein (TIGR02220 family)
MQTVRELYLKACDKLTKPVVDQRLKSYFKRMLKRTEEKPGADHNKNACIAIISDLNQRAGYNYRDVPNTCAKIAALLQRGFTISDFMKVHEIKVKQWLHDDNMRPYLRPATLYLPSKFEGYLQEWYYEHKRKTIKEERAAIQTQIAPKQWQEFRTFREMYRYFNILPADKTDPFKDKMPYEVSEMVDNYVTYWVGNRLDEANDVYQKAKQNFKG